VRSSERPVSVAVTAPAIRWIPAIDQVWVLAALGLPIIAGLMGMTTIDLAYHVRVGNMILTDGIPRVDTLTLTAAGRPWLDQQWGAQVVLAAGWRIAGWRGLALFHAALMLATFAPVLLACRARGASERTASVLTLAAFVVSMSNLGMRPQMLALPLFTTTVWLVLDRREHPRRLWLVPLMASPWSNLHGSFVLAPALLGLALVEDLRRRDPSTRATAAVTAATLLATLANPFGPGAWRYALEIASSPTIRTTVQEWAPTSLRSLTGILFFASAGAVALLLARRRRPAPWIDLLWLAVFFVMALPALRGVVWWALVAPPIVAGLLVPTERPVRARIDRPRMNVVVLGSLLTVLLLVLPWRTQPDERTGAPPQLIDAPQRLVDATARSVPPGGRLFVSQPWGSWFELTLPDRPVFVDSRIEIFPERVWTEYAAVMDGREGWQSILDRWRVDAVVLQEEDSTLRSLISDDPGWRLAFRDRMGSVFVRA